ncbi:sulfite exporter TauE/SafE family protein [Candidatus Woesearchaeota archaeon]|nr:sulfite exporter TauE/SafE family protein [Candidatus Woesearchaeota archaeon]
MVNKYLIKIEFIAKGTTCDSCAKIIKKQALKVDGVKEVKFNFAKEKGSIVFDSSETDYESIFSKIEEKGYDCAIINPNESSKSYLDKLKKPLGWFFGLLGIFIAGYFILGFVDGIGLPQISQNMSYGLLFVVGLLTGFHCVSMCGGFVVSYTAKHAQDGTKSHKSHLLYGIGKTLSYTIIGAFFGLLGSIIAFTPFMRGVAGIIAGLFLLLFGLKMLNIFPVLRRIQFRTPKFINKFVGKKSSKNSSPLIIGLLNGLMIACGPLQAIYIMAAGTGSMIEGAKLLFIFALGTLPVMLGFGYLASYLSGKMTQKILKASGVIVIVLGLVMMNRGLALTGTGYDFNSIVTSVSAASGIDGKLTSTASKNIPLMNNGFQEIRMEVDRYGWSPDKFVLKKGVPVKWIIDGKEINGCNNAIQVPGLDIKFDIKKGEQVIEFTPTKEGVIPWSCWMGMIPGTFIVKDDINLDNQEAVEKELESAPVQPSGSCNGSCGSSTCGAAKGGGCGCGGG